jgi:hypothetical protein
MLKFFRKYNKWILAVGGTLLMITFLIPQAIQGLSQAGAFRTAKWASYTTSNNKSVTLSLADRDETQRQMKLLDELNPGVLQGLGVTSPEHWFLLVHEADEAGLIGGQSDGLRYLPEPREEILALLRDRTGEHPQFILETCANVRGVTRLQSEWVNAPQFSDRRLMTAARRLYHNVSGNMVVVKADRPEQPFEPTEEQVRNQFEEFKDTSPGGGEKGFGYKLPNRAKLEWIEVPAESVRDMIERSDAMNGVELRKHWAKHASRLGVEAPTSGPVPQIVRDDLLDELLTRKLEEIAKFGGDELDAAERGLARQAGYLVLPDDWAQRQPSLEHLAQRLQEQFKIELPAYRAIGDRWLTMEDVAKLPGIGEATTTQFGQLPLGLADLVSREQSFGDDSTIAIQKGVAGPALSGEDGSLYFFRVIDADPSRPPVSIDEVREQVVKDLQREAHFAELVAKQDELRAAAIDMGLLRFALAHNTAVHPSGLITERMQPPMPEIGYVEPVVKAIIDKGLQLPPGIAVADMTPDMKTIVIPVEQKLAVLVFEIAANNPLTEETYRTIASPMQNPSMPQISTTGQLQSTLRSKEIDNGELALKAFAFDTIAKRHNFEVIASQDEPAADAADDATKDAEAAKASSG